MVQSKYWGLEQRVKRAEIIILILCVLIGFALRFYTFDKKCLWMDEIYTYNDSRDDFRGQLKFYSERPTFLHPPLFFLLTHLFYPFTQPERDLRVIPLIFGTASIPMIYFLAKLFLPSLALPCTLSLTFMAYHISLSQDGRCYSLIMFLGMLTLYFFMKYNQTSHKVNLLCTAIGAAILFHISYASIPFIFLFQLLWFYQAQDNKQPTFFPMVLLNGLIFLFSVPWLLFIALNYKGHFDMGLESTEKLSSLMSIFYGVLNDWVPFAPQAVASIILLFLLPLFSKNRKNGLILLSLFILPVGGVYLYCRIFNISHFISSKYFINFLPLFFISLFLSLDHIDTHFGRLKRFLSLKLLFLIVLIGSNVVMLPLYYRSEKQDYRGLMNYLKGQIRNGDKIIAGNPIYIGVMLHHLGVYPEGRHYVIPGYKLSENELENRITLNYRDKTFTILYSKSHWFNYLRDGSRLWLVADKENAKIIQERLSCIPKAFFDGSFFNLKRFPTDASIYLFLCDPLSPEEKGIEMPIE